MCTTQWQIQYCWRYQQMACLWLCISQWEIQKEILDVYSSLLFSCLWWWISQREMHVIAHINTSLVFDGTPVNGKNTLLHSMYSLFVFESTPINEKWTLFSYISIVFFTILYIVHFWTMIQKCEMLVYTLSF